MTHRDIYTEDKVNGGINEYFDSPCQVLFIDEGDIDYVESDLEHIINGMDKDEIPYDENGDVDIIKVCLANRYYNGGIAYCDQIICGCCGGIVDMDCVYFIRLYDWLNISNEIVGDDDIMSTEED